MIFKDRPEDRKISIHNKYNRRLRRLSISIEEFLKLADMKLDRSLSGKIQNRAQIEQIAKKCRELATLIPDPRHAIAHPPVRDNFFEAFQQTHGVTEQLISANDFFKDLTKK
jgi:hypothetical protein